ncbi:PQQ-binding-like beta-propeller repeat protein [Massilia sp. SR12]
MRPQFHLACLLLLTACGGGGGGSTTSPTPTPVPTPSNSWLQFTPPSGEISAYEGHKTVLTLKLKSSKTLPNDVGISVKESKGVINPKIGWTPHSNTEFSLFIEPAALPPGSYSTQLEVRLCEDSALVCNRPVQGSPWIVPLNVVIKPSQNLTALADLPGVGDWRPYNGGLAHNAYVPGTFDPAKFSMRWSHSHVAPQNWVAVNEITTANGVIFVRVSAARKEVLRALDEASGQVLWETAVDYDMSPPVAADGKLYAATSNSPTGKKELVAYSQKTGALLSRTELPTVDAYVPPQYMDGAIYSYGKKYGVDEYTISRIDTQTGQAKWRTDVLQAGFRPLSGDSEYLYSIYDSKLSILRNSDGKLITAAAPFDCSAKNPIVAPKGILYSSCGILTAFDTLNKKNLWKTSAAGFSDGMALGGKILYAVREQVLEARRIEDGSLIWSSEKMQSHSGDTYSGWHIIATDNIVFVSNLSFTYAYDINSRKQVASYPYGGPLALSSKGVLYIQGITGNRFESNRPTLIAINLR